MKNKGFKKVVGISMAVGLMSASLYAAEHLNWTGRETMRETNQFMDKAVTKIIDQKDLISQYEKAIKKLNTSNSYRECTIKGVVRTKQYATNVMIDISSVTMSGDANGLALGASYSYVTPVNTNGYYGNYSVTDGAYTQYNVTASATINGQYVSQTKTVFLHENMTLNFDLDSELVPLTSADAISTNLTEHLTLQLKFANYEAMDQQSALENARTRLRNAQIVIR